MGGKCGPRYSQQCGRVFRGRPARCDRDGAEPAKSAIYFLRADLGSALHPPVVPPFALFRNPSPKRASQRPKFRVMPPPVPACSENI